jgi:hypothetical protein
MVETIANGALNRLETTCLIQHDLCLKIVYQTQTIHLFKNVLLKNFDVSL